MRRLLLLLALLLALLTPAAAQDAPPLVVGRTVDGTLAADGEDLYTLRLDAGRFVAGTVDQQTVDVVVTVVGPDGAELARFDGPARGREPFQFASEAAGDYRLRVASFENGAGRYALRVDRDEPVATTPEGTVRQLLAAFDRDDAPGVVVAAVRDGEIVFSEAYGMANLTHGVPFTVDTPTNIGSTSKQFTAFAVALLAAQGRLDLDADVRTYLPELPDLGATVTLRHLLTHTSGYREFINTLALGGRRIGEGDAVDRDELIAIVQRQPELQNAPGAEWNYNNTGYGLLARIVEDVTGQPFPAWMDEHVFTPLGMDDTFVRAHPADIVPGSAQGYLPSESGFRAAADLSGAMGAGTIYTTAGDLARWMLNLQTGAHGGRDVVDAMTTPYVLTSGDTTSYGLGLFFDEERGQRRIQHGGADTAHRSSFILYPDLDAGFIVLSNHPTLPGTIPDAVAEAFLGDALAAPADPAAGADAAAEAAFDPETFDPATFDAFAGRYALDAVPGFVLTFRRDGDRLVTQATGQDEITITPTSDSSFAVADVNAAVTFHRGPDGRATALTLHQNGDHRAQRLDEAESVDLSDYAGRYFSEELETFYTLTVENDTLVLSHRRLDDIPLAHGTGDTFTGGFPVANVSFVRDDAGRVTGLRAGNGRTRDVWFAKQD